MDNQNPEPPKFSFVQQLYNDLQWKYNKYATEVERLWRMFNEEQRAICLKTGSADGKVLENRHDTKRAIVHNLIPEWNLHDIAKQGPEYLLNLLLHRATVPLHEQYWSGFQGEPGDFQFILNSMLTNGLRFSENCLNCFTIFEEGFEYGRSFEITSGELPNNEAFEQALCAKTVIPQSIGELIVRRQVVLIQCLSVIIDDILDQDQAEADPVPRIKKYEMASLSPHFVPPPALSTKPSLQDLKLRVNDHKAYVEEYLHLLLTEPALLAHAVNIGYFTRPELIPDKDGRQLPVHSEVYISSTVFVVVHNAIRAAAIWRYLARLFDLFETSSKDKACQAIILQEISSVYQFEYYRARSSLKRHVQWFAGRKWFYRLADRVDLNGDAITTLKDKPEKLTRKNPQLHYLLRLCQPQGSMSQAVQWIEKLGTLHEHHPKQRDELTEEEIDALFELNAIISLNLDTTKALPLPPPARTRIHRFISRLQDLYNELSQLRNKVDLRDFVIPIDQLLKPNMADNALKTLHTFIVDKVGASMEFLYDDLVSSCFAELQSQCQLVKSNGQPSNHVNMSGFSPCGPQTTEEKLAERKQKFKTRPVHPVTDEIAQQPAISESNEVIPPQKLKVQSTTVAVFTSLFDKSQARASISWSDFQSAMVDIGFSIMPKYGSVYTFFPPSHMNATQSLTLHRPHRSQIEKYKILIFAQRLHRVYGWDEQTFEAV